MAASCAGKISSPLVSTLYWLPLVSADPTSAARYGGCLGSSADTPLRIRSICWSCANSSSTVMTMAAPIRILSARRKGFHSTPSAVQYPCHPSRCRPAHVNAYVNRRRMATRTRQNIDDFRGTRIALSAAHVRKRGICHAFTVYGGTAGARLRDGHVWRRLAVGAGAKRTGDDHDPRGTRRSVVFTQPGHGRRPERRVQEQRHGGAPGPAQRPFDRYGRHRTGCNQQSREHAARGHQLSLLPPPDDGRRRGWWQYRSAALPGDLLLACRAGGRTLTAIHRRDIAATERDVKCAGGCRTGDRGPRSGCRHAWRRGLSDGGGRDGCDRRGRERRR